MKYRDGSYVSCRAFFINETQQPSSGFKGGLFMKRIFGLFLVFMMIFSLLGCGNKVSTEEDDIFNFVKEYKSIQYSINDPNNPPTGNEIEKKVRKFLSEDCFKEQTANRIFSIAPNFAKEENKMMELEDLILTKDKENADGTVDYKYKVKLKVKDDEGFENIEKKGQLTISNDNGNLKITRDWEEKIKIGNTIL